MDESLLPIASAILLGTIGVAHLINRLTQFQHGDQLTNQPLDEKRAKPLQFNEVSVSMLLKKISEFGLILFSCYLAEHHPPFPHGEKVR